MSFRPRAGISVFRIGQASCLTVPLFSKEGPGEIILLSNPPYTVRSVALRAICLMLPVLLLLLVKLLTGSIPLSKRGRQWWFLFKIRGANGELFAWHRIPHILTDDMEMVASLPRGEPEAYLFRHPSGKPFEPKLTIQVVACRGQVIGVTHYDPC